MPDVVAGPAFGREMCGDQGNGVVEGRVFGDAEHVVGEVPAAHLVGGELAGLGGGPGSTGNSG